MKTLDLLDQDEIWVAKDGRELRLADMDAGHRANLLTMLMRHSAALHWRYGVRLALLAMPEPDIDSVAYNSVSNDLDRQMDMDPSEWLAERPLVRKLEELIAADRAWTS